MQSTTVQSVGVEDKTDALKDPVANVLGCMNIRLKDETDAHCITTLGRHIHRCTKRVLQYNTQKDAFNVMYTSVWRSG